MRQTQTTLHLSTSGPGLTDITGMIAQVVESSGLVTGLCCVTILHTSASLLIQENADPSARRDLERFLERLAPEGDPTYTHTTEGPDDMPSHLRSAVTRTTETIPIAQGRLALGTWQGLYLAEHRRRPHERRLLVHLLGE